MWGARAGVVGASPWLGVRARAEARDSTSPALARTHCSLLTTHDAPGERNYHVFYQLLAGMPAAELAALHLDAPLDSFGLVNQSGCVSIPGQDEAVEFARTRTAMGAVGLSEAEQRDTTRAVAAVLLLAQLAHPHPLPHPRP